MRRIAFYGGTFDPPHRGHLAIAETLLKEFDLDEFIFLPAFHAPHKTRTKPTSAYDRFAMLCRCRLPDGRDIVGIAIGETRDGLLARWTEVQAWS